ncbi:MAG: hydroxymethylbilane synthase [Acidobacteria bacterium]|nr:hydroxymethylbilane synthase [Acidobacteriota bacterium]
MMRKLIIGSRGSQLALWQSNHVASELQKCHPHLQVSIEIIRTSGDKITDSALARLGSTKGLFVKEIEDQLLEKKVDLAVHSMKDVPTELPDGLEIGAIPPREDAADVLVSDEPVPTLAQLPQNAAIGTSSLRRTVQLRHLRPDLQIHLMRGNVDTRIRKMREQGLNAIVLAAAGLRRLGLARFICYRFPFSEMIPAVGQGALAIEIRSQDSELKELLSVMDHLETRRCVYAERTFLRRMGGGCQVPMGAHAFVEYGQAEFLAFVANPDATQFVEKRLNGTLDELSRLALEAAEYLLANGAEGILKSLPVS